MASVNTKAPRVLPGRGVVTAVVFGAGKLLHSLEDEERTWTRNRAKRFSEKVHTCVRVGVNRSTGPRELLVGWGNMVIRPLKSRKEQHSQ